jgi:arginyl-tRNA synthetase
VIESGVEPDAFKYYILSQNSDTPIDFDIELASDKSEKNPVYYIKYAHARICSILAKTGDQITKPDFSLLVDKKEIALYKEIVKFPELINEIAEDFQIQALPHFAYKIAKFFHDFYGSCHIIGEEENLKNARIALILATKYVLMNSLNICGIEAPKKM